MPFALSVYYIHYTYICVMYPDMAVDRDWRSLAYDLRCISPWAIKTIMSLPTSNSNNSTNNSTNSSISMYILCTPHWHLGFPSCPVFKDDRRYPSWAAAQVPMGRAMSTSALHAQVGKPWRSEKTGDWSHWSLEFLWSCNDSMLCLTILMWM